MTVRDVDTLLGPAVADTIAQLELAPEDHAAARLAARYAAAIDDADDDADALEHLGPKLLSVLESLGATPRSRAKTTKTPVNGVQNRLEALRAAR